MKPEDRFLQPCRESKDLLTGMAAMRRWPASAAAPDDGLDVDDFGFVRFIDDGRGGGFRG